MDANWDHQNLLGVQLSDSISFRLVCGFLDKGQKMSSKFLQSQNVIYFYTPDKDEKVSSNKHRVMTALHVCSQNLLISSLVVRFVQVSKGKICWFDNFLYDRLKTDLDIIHESSSKNVIPDRT
jgi:hypothetical protein